MKTDKTDRRFKGRKVFISGPMTGYRKYNFPKFDAWKERLEKAGAKLVVNPADVSRTYHKKEIEKYDTAFRLMVGEQLKRERAFCDTILLLDGWEASRGVREELKLALDLGFVVMLETPGDKKVLRKSIPRKVLPW